jgi:hypothetical protein
MNAGHAAGGRRSRALPADEVSVIGWPVRWGWGLRFLVIGSGV